MTATLIGAPMEESPLLTVEEVARYLRVSGMTVYRLIKAEKLEALRIGKSLRIREVDLQTYVDSVRGGSS